MQRPSSARRLTLFSKDNMNTARCAAQHMPPSPDTKQDAKQEEKTLFPGGIKRILVCQLRQIGDVLLATPSIELLARHYPEAELHVLTERRIGEEYISRKCKCTYRRKNDENSRFNAKIQRK